MSKKILIINFFDENTNEYDKSLDRNIFATELYTFLNFSSEDFMSKLNDDEIYQQIKNNLQYVYDMFKGIEKIPDAYIKKVLKELKTSLREEYYSRFKTVKLETEDIQQCLNFIKDNLEFFKDKDIIIPGIYTVEKESYLKCLDVSNQIHALLPNAKLEVNVVGDFTISSLEDYKSAYKIIENIVELIKSLNLSPLEQIMFAYDIVKGRKYAIEETEEDAYKSRDLISSVLGDKIVCVVFSTIFEAILSCLGIKNKSIALEAVDDKRKPGHERTTVYVDDDKYGVHGHFLFDVTFDSKSDSQTDYQNNYQFFLKTSEDMSLVDRKMNLIMTNADFLYPSYIYQVFKELPDNYSQVDYLRVCRRMGFNYYLKNLGLNTIEIESENNSKEKLIKAFKTIYESFNNPIEPEKFVELLYNVKKVEYYLNPTDTPFSIDDLKKSIKLNQFTIMRIDRQTKIFINNILNMDEESFYKAEREKLYKRTLTENKEREIETIKLTRKLRNYLEDQK